MNTKTGVVCPPRISLFIQNSLGGQNAVDGSGHDAARVACALAAGIEAGNVGLPVLPAQDSHGRRASGLRRGHDSIGGCKAVKLFVELRQCVLQYLRDTLRKNLMQIAERHAGTIRRLDVSKRRARPVREKIPHQLRGRVIILPAGFKRRPLELLLIPYAAERSLVREILGVQRDEKRGVRVLAVPR